MKSAIADFPDWFGPMLVKELRQGLKSRGFVLSFVGLQVVLILVVIFYVLRYSQNQHDFDASGLGAIFWFLIGGLLLVVTPLRAFNELAAERKANTLELIFMSGLTAWRITFGKWVSLLFQSLLFLLAVLPYAILRYYFGAVDLAGDLSTMVAVLLSCGVLSAVALAISGLPLWARILAAILALPFIVSMVSAVPAYIFASSMGGSGIGMSGWFSISSSGGSMWWLLIWNLVLISLIALQIGAAAVAPLAENHSGSQRFLALLLWVPLPILHWSGVPADVSVSQAFLFAVVAGVLAWYHLSTVPQPLRSFCRPFAGRRAPWGMLFQPGWPGAVIFVLVSMLLMHLTVLTVEPSMGGSQKAWPLAFLSMAAAALFCSTLVWLVARPRAKHPLVEQSLFLILCGIFVIMIMAGKPSGTHLGESVAFSFVPPIGLWIMMDNGDPRTWGELWCTAGVVAMVGYALVLLLRSRNYWVHYFRTCRELAVARPLEPAPEGTPLRP